MEHYTLHIFKISQKRNVLVEIWDLVSRDRDGWINSYLRKRTERERDIEKTHLVIFLNCLFMF